MGHNNREIEMKLVARGHTDLSKLSDLIGSNLKSVKITRGASKDVYWKAPGGKKDFIRVRFMEDGRAQITLKRIDKGDTFDRVEIDLEASDPDQAVTLLESLLGKPMGIVKKAYTVFWADTKDTTVSAYKVFGDKRVFVEIEARSKAKVETLRTHLEKKAGLKLERINKSLFQIFVTKS